MTALLFAVATLLATADAGAPLAQPVQVPPLLAGDWILVGKGATGRLHVATGGADVTVELHEQDSDEPEKSAERYRVAGALGTALVLEPVATAPSGSAGTSLPLPPRTRLLSVSATTALWWQPHRRALLAYRERPVPPAFLGHYTINKGESDDREIEVGATTVMSRRGDDHRDEDSEDEAPAPVRILAVTDILPESVRILLDQGGTPSALRIQLHGRRATLVQEPGEQADNVLEASFVPTHDSPSAHAPKSDAGVARTTGAHSDRAPVLPGLLGSFHLSSLSKNDEQTLNITSTRWTFLPAAGSTGATGWPEINARLGAGSVRMQLGSGHYGVESFTIRRIDDDRMILILEQGGQVHVLYRPEAPPSWVPLTGLSEDVRLLCRELEAIGSRLDEQSLDKAFARVSLAARSDTMRSIAEAVRGAPKDLRPRLLERGLVDAGEPIPACPGVDRFRAARGIPPQPR